MKSDAKADQVAANPMRVPPKPRTPPTVVMGWKMFSGEEMAEER